MKVGRTMGMEGCAVWHMLCFSCEELVDVWLNTEEMFDYAPFSNDMWVERLS